MKPSMIYSLLSALCTLFMAFGTADAATQPLSKYGQIQNVQDYSSNPFWNPSSPYNQRMPQPIYVQGTDVDTGDCTRVVSALVASYCATRNNCIGVILDDARPTLTVQLASIPNHNYVTACAGFLDSAFKTYKDNYANAAPRASGVATPFPAASGIATDNNTNSNIKIKNPYQEQLPSFNGDNWGEQIMERTRELEDLQAQNGANDVALAKTDFPTTAADLTMSERMANKAAGYEPFKGTSAYQQLNIEDEETYLERQAQRRAAYCDWAQKQLAALDADLATLQNCMKQGVRFADCKTLGVY